MLNHRTLTSDRGRYLLFAGLCVGLAGGLAEIGVIWAYSVFTGGDASVVARHVASAVGLGGTSTLVGLCVHMSLALVLGVALCAAELLVVAQPLRAGATFAFMVSSLSIVWLLNFFVVLPAVSPSFVHLLPYAVTFASKLAFGLAGAATLIVLQAPPLATKIVGYGDRTEVAI